MYTAAFGVYPGPNTNLIKILQQYKGDDWPKWTGDRLSAYDTLTKIATSGNNQTGTGIIDFSGSFEHVGEATTAKISAWLTSTWAPFQAILDSADKDQEKLIAANIYNDHAFPVINIAYATLTGWLNVATPFIDNQNLQDAYTHIHGTLLTANQDRTNIASFLSNLNAGQAAYQQLVGSQPTLIANLLTNGLTKIPDLKAPVQQFAWLKTLLGSLSTILSGVAGLFGGPPASVSASILLNGVANTVDAWLDGLLSGGKKPPAPGETDTTGGVDQAALQMQNFLATSFNDSFDLLASPRFQSSLFSNYGLLQAMEHVVYIPPGAALDANAAVSQVLLNNYDLTVWKQLLPRMFTWKMQPYVDEADTNSMPDNVLRNFTFFVPLKEHAQGGFGGDSGDYSQGPDAVTRQAKAELLQLQSAKPFTSRGDDFTPEGTSFPGPISVAQPLVGNSGSLYTITTNSHIEGLLNKARADSPGPFPVYEQINIALDGDTIHEWALETSNGYRISQGADQRALRHRRPRAGQPGSHLLSR